VLCQSTHPKHEELVAISNALRINRLPLEKLVATEPSKTHPPERLDWQSKVDRSRWYVCPSSTPLYYAPIYNDLDRASQLRYNQLTAVLFNELISFFESEFASSVCIALNSSNDRKNDSTLSECLQGFVADEQEHIRWWQRLSQMSEPDWYCESQNMLLHIPRSVRLVLRYLTRNPRWFPVVFWVMLALEERSLDISRRCLRMKREEIEPHYLSIYHDHLKDETRHVHLDWHLIDRYYASASVTLRKFNARLLRTLIARFFLPPNRSALRVVRKLVEERRELAPLLPTLEKQLLALGTDRAYQEMMYSRQTTPITFKLFDRFPEMHGMQQAIQTYSVQSDLREL